MTLILSMSRMRLLSRRSSQQAARQHWQQTLISVKLFQLQLARKWRLTLMVRLSRTRRIFGILQLKKLITGLFSLLKVALLPLKAPALCRPRRMTAMLLMFRMEDRLPLKTEHMSVISTLCMCTKVLLKLRVDITLSSRLILTRKKLMGLFWTAMMQIAKMVLLRLWYQVANSWNSILPTVQLKVPTRISLQMAICQLRRKKESGQLSVAQSLSLWRPQNSAQPLQHLQVQALETISLKLEKTLSWKRAKLGFLLK